MREIIFSDMEITFRDEDTEFAVQIMDAREGALRMSLSYKDVLELIEISGATTFTGLLSEALKGKGLPTAP
jgi:predicted peroxiredoxin